MQCSKEKMTVGGNAMFKRKDDSRRSVVNVSKTAEESSQGTKGIRGTRIAKRNKLTMTIAVVVVIAVVTALVKENNFNQGNASTSTNYDYQTDKANSFKDFKKEENSNFSKVNSSIRYKMSPYKLHFKPNELTANVSKQPDNYPFTIKSLTHKNNGLFLCLEFKDSGFIKDFQMKIKVNENSQTVSQSLIDCSNQIKLYVPFSFSQEITAKGVTVTLSNFYWKKTDVITMANIDYEKGIANSDYSQVKIKAKGNEGNNNNGNATNTDDNISNTDSVSTAANFSPDTYTVKCKGVMDLTLAKTSYNSMHLKTNGNLGDLAESLEDFALSKASTKYYLIFVSSHNQTDSNKFYLHQEEDTILQSNDKIEQVKICIEKE